MEEALDINQSDAEEPGDWERQFQHSQPMKAVHQKIQREQCQPASRYHHLPQAWASILPIKDRNLIRLAKHLRRRDDQLRFSRSA
jgi:hypothetical protein